MRTQPLRAKHHIGTSAMLFLGCVAPTPAPAVVRMRSFFVGMVPIEDRPPHVVDVAQVEETIRNLNTVGGHTGELLLGMAFGAVIRKTAHPCGVVFEYWR